MFGRLNRVSSVRRSKARTAGRLRSAAWGAVEALEGRVLLSGIGNIVPNLVSDLDDELSEAKFGTVGQTVSNQQIDVGTDVDLSQFRVFAGQRLSFDVDIPNSTLDSFLRLFD